MTRKEGNNDSTYSKPSYVQLAYSMASAEKTSSYLPLSKMQQRGNIPAFGDWEGSDNVPFTEQFDNERKSRVRRKPFNPNDPQGDSPFRVTSDLDVPKTKETSSTRAMIASRTSKGYEHRIEGSPNHLHYHVMDDNKVNSSGSPSRGKSQPEGGHDFGSSTPGRLRMKPLDVREEKSEKSYAVPKFGTWDASDPSTADKYSDIFNKVREERKTPKVPIIKTDPDLSVIYPGQAKKDSSKSWWSSCFGWCKK